MTYLTLPYPVSANRNWRHAGGNTYLSAEARAYRRDVACLAKAGGVLRPLEGRVRMEIDVHPPRPKDWERRARKDEGWHWSVRCIDIDNALKVVLDALQGVAFVNDRQVVRLTVVRQAPVDGGAVGVGFGEVE